MPHTQRNVTSDGGCMAQTPEPLEKLVKVFDTDVESEAMVVRGLLASAGNRAVVRNREAPRALLPARGRPAGRPRAGARSLPRPSRPRRIRRRQRGTGRAETVVPSR